MVRLHDFGDIEMTDSEKYYNDIFSAVAEDIKEYRDEKYISGGINIGKGESLFQIADEDFTSFEKLINAERGSIRYAVELIIQQLLKQNNITVYPPESHPDRVGRPCCYLSMAYQKNENLKTGVKIVWNVQELHGLKYFQNQIDELNIKKEVDELEIVVLEKEYQNKDSDIDSSYYFEHDHPTLTEIERFNISAQKDMPGFIRFIPIDVFFIQHFGQEEYSLFEKAVDTFNKEKESMVGYKTFFMPNEIEVEKFKNERIKDFKVFDFKKELRDALFQLNQSKKLFYKTYCNLINDLDSLHDKCYKNLFNNGRFLVMFGNMDFAESYISSEWYYYSSFETDILDKTAIAVGYLKSAEQLLYKLLRLHINDTIYNIQHCKIKKKDIPDFLKNADGNLPTKIPFIETNEDYFDTTFGSLIGFVMDYKDSGLFEPGTSSNWKTFIKLYLDDYRKDDRNEHLHKDNIYSADEIRTIRKRTLLLYFILLGSFHIKDDLELKQLGGDEAFFKVDMLVDMTLGLSEWIAANIKQCHSASSTIILSPCFERNMQSEIMRFAEIEEFDNTVHDEYNYNSDEFEFSLGEYISVKQRCELLSKMIESCIKIQKALTHAIDNHKIVLLLYGEGYRIIQ